MLKMSSVDDISPLPLAYVMCKLDCNPDECLCSIMYFACPTRNKLDSSERTGPFLAVATVNGSSAQL